MKRGSVGMEVRKRVAEDVKRLIGGHMGIQATMLNENDRVWEDLGADAFDRAELVLTVNERFKVRVPLDAASHISTVADLVDAVCQRLGDAHREFLTARAPVVPRAW